MSKFATGQNNKTYACDYEGDPYRDENLPEDTLR